MYSSCPNVIKHFVPLKFSQASLDYSPSSTPIKEDVKIGQIPFTNKKLQCLKSDPKDYVLIFKNKSYATYSPRKKIHISPSLIKQMRNKNYQINLYLNQQQQVNKNLCTPFDDGQKQYIQPRRIQSMDKFRNFRVDFRDTSTSTSGKKRIRFSTKYNSTKQTRQTMKSAKQNKYCEDRRNLMFYSSSNGRSSGNGNSNLNVNTNGRGEQNQQIKNIIAFKIRGCKAPKSETVDFYKQIKMDDSYILASRLAK